MNARLRKVLDLRMSVMDKKKARTHLSAGLVKTLPWESQVTRQATLMEPTTISIGKVPQALRKKEHSTFCSV